MKAIEDFLFEWIARDLREGKCIPFLGAGASAFPKEANAKPPSAAALAMELAKESMYPPYQTIREAAASNDTAARERLLRATVDCENLCSSARCSRSFSSSRDRSRDRARPRS